MINQAIIIKPIITEESMEKANLGKFSFVVSKASNKNTIKRMINSSFGVHVVSIATSIVKGKTKRAGKYRRESLISTWKRAIVTLKKGERISLFEAGVGGEK